MGWGKNTMFFCDFLYYGKIRKGTKEEVLNKTGQNLRHLAMDNLQLTGRYLGRVFNSKSGCMCPKHLFCYEAKQPNLKLKTRPKLLGSLPSFRAPRLALYFAQLK
jgi:hypothetical protein